VGLDWPPQSSERSAIPEAFRSLTGGNAPNLREASEVRGEKVRDNRTAPGVQPRALIDAFELEGLEHCVHRLTLTPSESKVSRSANGAAIRISMGAILKKAGVPEDKAHRVINEAIHAALALLRDVFMVDQRKKATNRDKVDANELVLQLRSVADAIDELPPASKGKLNKILETVVWGQFDTEEFCRIVDGIIEALKSVSPKCHAQEVHLQLVERRCFLRQKIRIASIRRSAQPAIRELWENMAACRDIEAGLRKSGSKRKSLSDFLRYAADLLELQQVANLRPVPLRAYLRRLVKITQDCGLSYKPTHDWRSGTEVEREFQAIAKYAIAAVGANQTISRRQIRALRANL
jgi:hypothetical protein